MEQWIEHAWDFPYDNDVENELHSLKQSAQTDPENTDIILKYVSLLTAQAFRQSIVEIPADVVTGAGIIAQLKNKIELKFRPLENLLSELNGASMDVKHLYDQYFQNIQTEGLCPTTHTSSRYTRDHHSYGYGQVTMFLIHNRTMSIIHNHTMVIIKTCIINNMKINLCKILKSLV